MVRSFTSWYSSTSCYRLYNINSLKVRVILNERVNKCGSARAWTYTHTGVCVCEFELFFILARHLLFVLCHFYSRFSDFYANSVLALPIKLFIGVFGGIFFWHTFNESFSCWFWSKIVGSSSTALLFYTPFMIKHKSNQIKSNEWIDCEWFVADARFRRCYF